MSQAREGSRWSEADRRLRMMLGFAAVALIIALLLAYRDAQNSSQIVVDATRDLDDESPRSDWSCVGGGGDPDRDLAETRFRVDPELFGGRRAEVDEAGDPIFELPPEYFEIDGWLYPIYYGGGTWFGSGELVRCGNAGDMVVRFDVTGDGRADFFEVRRHSIDGQIIDRTDLAPLPPRTSFWGSPAFVALIGGLSAIFGALASGLIGAADRRLDQGRPTENG